MTQVTEAWQRDSRVLGYTLGFGALVLAAGALFPGLGLVVAALAHVSPLRRHRASLIVLWVLAVLLTVIALPYVAALLGFNLGWTTVDLGPVTTVP